MKVVQATTVTKISVGGILSILVPISVNVNQSKLFKEFLALLVPDVVV